MTFRRVVVERIGISGPESDRQAALDWCAENGLAPEQDKRQVENGRFRVIASRIVRDARSVKWTATAKQLRRTP